MSALRSSLVTGGLAGLGTTGPIKVAARSAASISSIPHPHDARGWHSSARGCMHTGVPIRGPLVVAIESLTVAVVRRRHESVQGGGGGGVDGLSTEVHVLGHRDPGVP